MVAGVRPGADREDDVAGGRRRGEPPADRRRRRRWWPWLLLGALVLLAGLGYAALRLRPVQQDATAARTELVAAKDALAAHDLAAAKAHLRAARDHVDDAAGPVNGLPGTIWSPMPVVGSAVRDVRHLVSALDDAVSVAEISVDIYPQVMSGDNELITGQDTVDLKRLRRVVAAVEAAGPHLEDASAALSAVSADAPVIGASLAAARDDAQAQLAPVVASYDALAPMLKVLPRALGSSGEISYLIAIMNPAELRYSGGATLSLATAKIADGRASFAPPVTVEEFTQRGNFIRWNKVPGNPFHRVGRSRLTNATFSPYWSVSGEELLRAWAKTSGQDCDAVVVIDLQALSRLMAITGPVQVPSYGELNSGNLVQVLAGSYDTYDNYQERKALNASLIPTFRAQLFSGGRYFQKLRTLADAAAGRHFAMYFRDPAIQAGFADAGVGGDLSETDHDYLGVFSQNTNGSKLDYWQTRTVDSDVTLRADGSAIVRLTVTVANPSPAYTRSEPDPRGGYFTRWLGTVVAMFLPKGAEVTQAAEDGKPIRVYPQLVGDRPYFREGLLIPPSGQAILTARYTVPRAATVSADGRTLTYRLDLDPQALVVPQATTVRLRWPEGYSVGALPPGWSSVGATQARFATPGLDASQSWTITLLD